MAALLAVIMVAACGAPGGGPAGIAPPDDVPTDPQASLTVGTVAVPTGFDPHRERSGGERPYTFLVFDRLTTVDSSMRARPMLATGWELAPDGLSLTMDLRPGVTFHDGTPFDAAAAAANIERAKTIEGSTSADDLATVQAVEVVGPTEVRFVLSAPTPELPELLAGPSGAMISPTSFADPAVDLLKDPGLSGTGPYVVGEFVPNEHVVFRRAPGPNWDPDAGRLAELELRFMSDDRTRASALRAGELDVMYVNSADAGAVKEAEVLARSGRFVHHRSPTGVLQALLMRSSVLTDRRIRQAIIQAIDRDAIVHGLLQDTCSASDQLIREGYPGHSADFTDPLPHDPDAARRLLAEAGVTDGLDLDIFFITGRPQVPEVAQHMLSEVGIRADVTPLTSIEVLSAYRGDRAATWGYQITPDLGIGATVDYIMAPSGIGGQSPAVDAAATTARTALAPDERERATAELAQVLAAEAFFVPFCHLDANYVMTEQVVGFDSAPVPYAQFMLDLRYVAKMREATQP
ncbi:ABC transporter substrate-binding protein [Pseudonocardia kunmingensis]|uniref:ABC transporter substrate-binding protein n=1 Tax=Pseudonocardia kunmingensis TaxID=630975 RepID=UPI001478F830|nr:ABC transporter substrate-binding protein [Pseudonocardia kunmingensis]